MSPIKIAAVLCLLVAAVGCHDAEGACGRILDACHDIDPGSGPIHDCHVAAEADGVTEEICADREDECLAICK